MQAANLSVWRIESNRNFFCPNWNAVLRRLQYVISAELMSLLHTALRRYLRGLHQAHRKSTWRREMGHGNGCFVDAGASRRAMCALRTVPRLRLRKKTIRKEFRRKAASRLEAPRNISSHFYGVSEPTIPGKKTATVKRATENTATEDWATGKLGNGKIRRRKIRG